VFSKFFKKLLSPTQPAWAGSGPLDYDKLHLLDAECLAEQGIAEAYRELLPTLRTYAPAPHEVDEVIDEATGSYSVGCNGRTHVVYSPDESGSEAASWGRATAIFFGRVNEQLQGSNVRFHAIDGGNDLGGMFLTEAEVEGARATLPRKSDWPYIPTMEGPWHGQAH
jgi:hypothetical protein